MNNEDIMHGIDNELQVNDDMATKMVTQLWMDVLAEKHPSDSGTVQTFTCYMNPLTTSVPGFPHFIATEHCSCTPT